MSNDFDWQTEDNEAWDETPLERPPNRDVGRLITWLKQHKIWVGLTAVLLVIVGGLVYFNLNRRVEEVEDTTSADVLAAHALVWQAAREKDFDLFNSLMAGGTTWSDLQLDLLNVDLFLDRRPLFLELDLESFSDTTFTPTVSLSADLETAEVNERLPYKVTSGELVSETVWLGQTFFYEREVDSWLLSPPPDDSDYWGAWQSSEGGKFVTLVHSEREAEIAAYLIDEFEALVGRICEDEAVDCPRDFELQIRLSHEMAALRTFNEPYTRISLTSNLGVYNLSLPSPAVIGMPFDEVGYEGLFQGYASWIAAIMITSFPSDAPVNYNIYTILDLERPPEPVLALPIPQPIPPPPIPFPDQDILVACSSFISFDLLRFDLNANRWSDEFSRGNPRIDFEDEESLFILNQVQNTFLNLAMLPDDSGTLFTLNRLNSDAEYFSLIFWQDGQAEVWLDSERVFQMFGEMVERQFDPNGRYLLVFDPEREIVDPPYYAIDLQACTQGNCELEDFYGFPHWSPDYSWAFIVVPGGPAGGQRGMVLRNNQTGEEWDFGSGFSPVWLDEENFLYILPEEVADDSLSLLTNVQIVAGNVGQPLSGTVLVESADISAAISGGDASVPINLFSVIVHPDRPDWLFLIAGFHPPNNVQENYLLAYNRETAELTALLNLEDGIQTGPLHTAMDGQYLVVPYGSGFETSDYENTLALIPLDPATMTAGPIEESYDAPIWAGYDWSLDGRWLLLARPGAIRLIAPGTGYDHTITYKSDNCWQAAWINKPAVEE